MSKVIVKAGKDGNFIFPTKNADLVKVRVESTGINLNAKGFESAPVSAFVTLRKSTAAQLKGGELIDGKIIAIETLSPQYEGHEPKRAGKEGNVITSAGQPVYRQTVYTNNVNAQDELLPSDRMAVSEEQTA